MAGARVRDACILFVDDEEDNRSLVKEILGFHGYRVLLASDGEEAIAIYREHQACIAGVVLDLIMPKMGGRETLIALKELNPDVPVLMISGYTEDDEIRRILEEDSAWFLRKPFQLADLVARVEELVQTGKR